LAYGLDVCLVTYARPPHYVVICTVILELADTLWRVSFRHINLRGWNRD